jgi:serine/threonine protein kinase
MADCNDFRQSPYGAAISATANAAMALHRRVSDKMADKVMEKVKDKVVGRFMTEKDFNRALAHYFPPSAGREEAPVVASFRDGDFLKFENLLQLSGKFEWSKRPRTFAILKMIGCTEALEGFIAEQKSDFYLPYTDYNLPSAVKGARNRNLFLSLQGRVLNQDAKDLVQPGGSHKHFDSEPERFFIQHKELGHGGFGSVDHVVDRLRWDHFARKRIPRGRSFKKDKEAIESFENELKTLKQLSHIHLVKLVGSYTDPKYVGLIMWPVADMDLATFLAHHPDSKERKICLRRFFGCLGTAVAYLHDNKIRHKDIKPENILVKDRKVLLTDFGTSRNWSDDTKSATSGTVAVHTPRYCAPEVADHAVGFSSLQYLREPKMLIAEQQRNPASDVWSLGCVFLEMCTVLHDRSVQDMKAFYQWHGSGLPFVRNNEAATVQWVKELQMNMESEYDKQPLELARWMTHIGPLDRPTAQQVVIAVFNFEGDRPYYGDCCDSSNNTTQVQYPEPEPKLMQDDHSEGQHSPLILIDNDAKQELEPEVQPEDSCKSFPSDEQTIRAISHQSTDESEESQPTVPAIPQVQDHPHEIKRSQSPDITLTNNPSTSEQVGNMESSYKMGEGLPRADLAPCLSSEGMIEEKGKDFTSHSFPPVEVSVANAETSSNHPAALNRQQPAIESPNKLPWVAHTSKPSEVTPSNESSAKGQPWESSSAASFRSVVDRYA